MGKPIRLIEAPRRERIPIWWASIKARSVEATAEMAEGWLPAMFVPEKHPAVWGADLRNGLARRPAELGRLEIAAGGTLAIGEHLVGDAAKAILDAGRDHMALYVGGMGAPGKNFYNDICRAYGYEREADEIQALFLAGKKAAAAASVPEEWLRLSNLVGPPSLVAERVAAYGEAGVTVLNVNPVGREPARQIEWLRTIVDDA
jgi:alkanesulfonate monooxygenase SsuD/methylene tetrahydromethanopterin reductase-like flavin-dependent oxidoreductase (luciferase family)